MLKASAFEKGMYAIIHGEPYLVTEREFVKPGKGGAFVRLRLKSCRTGAVMRETLSSEASVEEALIDRRPVQFLYSDGAEYHFMDGETYEQFSIPPKTIEERGRYMIAGEEYELIMWEESPLDIKIPLKIAYEVLEAPDAIRGNTVTGAVKTVVIQNDMEVRVPMFIKTGDHIIINTQTGEYVERAS